MRRFREWGVRWVASGAIMAVVSCGETVYLGERAPVFSEGDGGAAPGRRCEPTACRGKVYACGDCVDNDGDDRVDADDPLCLGPCDDTEDSYAGGIPGANRDACAQDCYFDDDSGGGNDECAWSRACDPLWPGDGSASPAGATCRCAGGDPATAPGSVLQSERCLDVCGPLTPNGCDCFGCCELPARTGNFVWLGTSLGENGGCDAAGVFDPERCEPCTPVASCLNACAECEVCAGDTEPAAGCSATAGDAAPGPGAACAEGITRCGVGVEAACPPLHYCVTGCCVEVPR